MPTIELAFASGETSLSVRRFAVHEALSAPFSVSVWARSPDPSLDLEALVGRPASLRVHAGYANVRGRARVWSGVVRYMELARPEEKGLATYHLQIVPRLWLLSNRVNYRIYQHLSIPAIVDKLLAEWEIARSWRIDRGRYPELEYKVQYEETDLAFLSRLLEEAGITLYFDDAGGDEAKLVLGDAPHANARREGPPIPYVDHPNQAAEREFVTQIHFGQEVRPGALAIRDVDFRRPAYGLLGRAPEASSPEARYEQFHYRPGAFLVEPGAGGDTPAHDRGSARQAGLRPDTPAADDRGIARHSEHFGDGRSGRLLLGERAGRRSVTFDANVLDLRPGTVFAIDGHPHPDVDGKPLLVTGFTIQGSPGASWPLTGHAVFADLPHVPPETTPRPVAHGVQSATVVGPKGDEIHTDEFGRVRVQFPWDREGKLDDQSASWIRVSQGWGGRGYGMIDLPRVGQEVLVGFLEGNPDQPVVVGRVYNRTEPVPYKLPENKTISTWKSNSSPGAEGFNEIKCEDRAGEELLYVQAQKNLRKLVKHDETITVLNDREKCVGVNETDTTGENRTEVTGANRTETTGANRTTFIAGNRAKLVKRNETEVTHGSRRLLVGKDVDIVVGGTKRERIEQDAHLHVKGDRRERIGGTQSLTVIEDQFEEVTGSHALSAGGEIHLAAVEAMVGEAADATLRGPGGFLRIDGAGVTIVGTIVDINVGGSAGDGRGSRPELPEEPERAKVKPPDDPVLKQAPTGQA